MVVVSEEIVEKGWQFTETFIILLITAVALVAAYIILRRWLWPVLRRSGHAPDRRVLSLIEQIVYLSLIVLGLRQAILRIAPDLPQIQDLFFLLYWILGIYFAIRLTSAITDWYLGSIAPRVDGTAHEKIVPIIKYIIFVIIVVLAIIVLMDYFGITRLGSYRKCRRARGDHDNRRARRREHH